MLIIKCGKKEFQLNQEDKIMYNGLIYQIITKEVTQGWSVYHPIIAKAKAEKLIREGKIVFSHKEKRMIEVDIYKVNIN